MDEIKNCLDTYALVEIKKGNLKFAKYMTANFVIAELTLAEFYDVLFREEGEEEADRWFNKLKAYARGIEIETLIEAVKFRRVNSKKNLSFFDCVGYLFAKSKGVKFVTGDKEFENLEGVEFIKA